MKIPPSKIARKARSKKIKQRISTKYDLSSMLDSRTQEKYVARRNFIKSFLDMYYVLVSDFFEKNDLYYYNSFVQNTRSRNIVGKWYDAMVEDEKFPFSYKTYKERMQFLDVNFWRKILKEFLDSNLEVNYKMTYLQTVNGIFLYVQNGKYIIDKARTSLSKKNLSNVITLQPAQYKYVLAVYTALLYQKSKNVKLTKNKYFRKFKGYLELYKGYPIFKKSLLENSDKFRAMLVDFHPYYLKYLEVFKIDDYMQYEELLDFIEDFYIDPNYEDAIFKMYSPERIKSFIKFMLGLVVED